MELTGPWQIESAILIASDFSVNGPTGG